MPPVQKGADSAILLTFDDGRISVYQNAYPAMSARSMKGTNYIITSVIGTDASVYTSAAQLQTMYAAGWDMGNHSNTHPNFTTMTQAEIEAEISTAKTALDGLSMSRASDHVAYPFGGYDSDVQAAMTAQSMKTGRGYSYDGNVSFDEVHSYGIYQLKTKNIYNTHSLHDAKQMVYDAALNNEKIMFVFHSVLETSTSQFEWQTAYFVALLDYIQSLDIPTPTISEWYAQYQAAYP